MRDKPLLVLDQHFRKLEELFRPAAFEALRALFRVEGGQNWPMEPARLNALVADASFLVSAFPELNADQIRRAPNLRAVIEVAGGFNDGLDYQACFANGIEVLSSAPGFRQSVAEMTLSMALAGGRGLVREHECFREGHEHWLDDRADTDFSLYGANVGFIGFGQIAQETARLMAPFAPDIFAFDPFLKAPPDGVTICSLPELVETCRVVVMAAVPSEQTKNLLNAQLIARLRPGALVILISRAWCVDFPALVDAAKAGKITFATDVFPYEPLLPDDPLRSTRNVILSPHRAAAVVGGRQLIGDMIVDDVRAILEGRPKRRLKTADPTQLAGLVSAQKAMQKDKLPNT